MNINTRLRSAISAAGVHLLFSLIVAALAAVIVFMVWYPFPYRELSGGRELFFLIMAVDVVCGPLLTMVLFNPAKPRIELYRDLGLVAFIQLGALAYGLLTVLQARPLFLVHEVDRFKVITAVDIDKDALLQLPDALKPSVWHGPVVVGLREPNNIEERNKVLLESIQGGRDYGERPEFYVPYNSKVALKSLTASKALTVFLDKYPDQKAVAQEIAVTKDADISQWKYLPVMGRQDWVALLDKQGQIQGFLKGDGF